MVNEQILSSVASSAIFSGLPDDLIKANLAHFKVKQFAEGEVILHEGQENKNIHIIHSGAAHVVKKLDDTPEHSAHIIATLIAGEEIGEMTALDGSVASATVKAARPMELISLDLGQSDTDQQLKLLTDQLQLRIAQRIASKLRNTNDRKAVIMEREVQRQKEQVTAGRFTITILTLVAIYTIALRAVLDLNVYSWMEVYYSPLIIVAFMGAMLAMMIRCPLPLKSFGLTPHNWRAACLDAILYSVVFCIGLTLVKSAYVYFVLGTGISTVFGTAEMFSGYYPDGSFNWYIYAGFFAAYVLLCPVQELIGRCGVQAPLFIFLQGSEAKRHFFSILVSNLMYSASHSHLNLTFAAITFIPGLFWGWLFMRHKSLISVSLSHAIIGGYALFALRLEEFLK